jgi:hypothetical protein
VSTKATHIEPVTCWGWGDSTHDAAASAGVGGTALSGRQAIQCRQQPAPLASHQHTVGCECDTLCCIVTGQQQPQGHCLVVAGLRACRFEPECKSRGLRTDSCALRGQLNVPVQMR